MRRSRHAFTLLELLLVLALLAMLLAIAWPAMNRSLDSHRLKRAAEMVQTHLAKTRTKAITSGEILSFRFQPGTANFRIEQQSNWNAVLASGSASTAAPAGGASAPTGGAMPTGSSATGAPNAAQAESVPPVQATLPEGISFVSAEVGADSRTSLVSVNDAFTSISDVPWSQPIYFFPDGTATAATIVLKGQRERSISVKLRSLTGGAKVVESEASQERRR